MSLRRVVIDLDTAREFVALWHRTHDNAPVRAKFYVGVADDQDVLRGVAMVGNPVARNNMDGSTVEVNRSATDGTRNANSLLYGAAAQAAKAMGFRRIITYNEDGEGGASLRAAGYVAVAELPPRAGWDMRSRRRADRGNGWVGRTRWERVLSPDARPWVVMARPADAAPQLVQPSLLDGLEAS